MDKVTKDVRSWMMSRVGPKNTAPELLLASWLRKNKISFRTHLRSLPGSPDFVLKKYHTVIFVHGCFWHGHRNCKYYRLPGTNTLFWEQKVDKNRLRDSTKNKALRKAGWRVIVVWQCQLKKEHFLKDLIRKIS